MSFERTNRVCVCVCVCVSLVPELAFHSARVKSGAGAPPGTRAENHSENSLIHAHRTVFQSPAHSLSLALRFQRRHRLVGQPGLSARALYLAHTLRRSHSPETRAAFARRGFRLLAAVHGPPVSQPSAVSASSACEFCAFRASARVCVRVFCVVSCVRRSCRVQSNAVLVLFRRRACACSCMLCVHGPAVLCSKHARFPAACFGRIARARACALASLSCPRTSTAGNNKQRQQQQPPPQQQQ